MVQTSFKRYEKKYLLRGDQYEQFLAAIEPYMMIDEFGQSMVCNIYYDTPQYDLIIRSLEKPDYKEKIRLRSYGIPEKDSLVFLEIKKKYDDIVYKRRLPMQLDQVQKTFRSNRIVGEGADGQIAKELSYFLQHYPLMPATYLAYDRIAMIGKEKESLRITFDENIRSRQERMDLRAGDKGEYLLPKGQAVMEIKVDDAYPFWLVQILEDLEIYPASFSKYGTVYRKQIFPKLQALREGRGRKVS